MSKSYWIRGLALMAFASLVSGMSVFAADAAKKRSCKCVQDGPDVLPFCEVADQGEYQNLLACMQGCPRDCKSSASKLGAKVLPARAK